MALNVIVRFEGAAPPSDQIYQQLRRVIVTGALGAGEKLPSVRQLARDIGSAVGTVAKAYRALEAEGLVTTRPGAGGTRVSDQVRAVPLAVLQEARSMATTAQEMGVPLEQALDALRVSWPGQAIDIVAEKGPTPG